MNNTNTHTMQHFTTPAKSLEYGDTIRIANGKTFTVQDAGWDEVLVEDAQGRGFFVNPNETVEVLTCLVY